MNPGTRSRAKDTLADSCIDEVEDHQAGGPQQRRCFSHPQPCPWGKQPRKAQTHPAMSGVILRDMPAQEPCCRTARCQQPSQACTHKPQQQKCNEKMPFSSSRDAQSSTQPLETPPHPLQSPSWAGTPPSVHTASLPTGSLQ